MSANEDPQSNEIKQLMEEKERLVQEGKYLEAEEIKQKINALKKDTSNQKTGELHENQIKERETLEGDYESERKDLEEKWDKKIKDFVEEGKKQEKELVELHNKKMEEYISKLTSEYPRIKYSTEYLNGRVQENKLAKQERYKEAAQKKLANDKMQQKENEKYEIERSENINKNAETLGIKQEQDLSVLRARLARIYDLLLKKKEKEFETLENKFKGKKQELVGIQIRQKNISENVNKDRAWEASNRLTSLALANKKENESIKKVEKFKEPEIDEEKEIVEKPKEVKGKEKQKEKKGKEKSEEIKGKEKPKEIKGKEKQKEKF